MRRLLPTTLILAAVGCATAGPKMTDLERHGRATIAVERDLDATVSMVSDFLSANGYAIDHYDEHTRLLVTGWASKIKGATKALVGGWDQKVQAKFTPGESSTAVEFWLFYRMDGEENLNPYQNQYDELMTRLRAYLADHPS
jgi:hypothetical protein